MSDVIVIGAGIVGLATARQLLLTNPNLKVTVLEKEAGVAEHQTGHNSGVIHSGLYYKPGSLKAVNCIRGYKLMLDFCLKENIPADICGKIVVATNPEEIPVLEKLFERGKLNGLDRIRKITSAEIKEIEPHVKALSGIHVPYAGIVNYRKVAARLAEVIRGLGGEIILGAKVAKIITRDTDFETITADERIFKGKFLVNCGGLYSDKLALQTQPKEIDLRIVPFRGEYYTLSPETAHLVKNLIYPVPDPSFPFLGVHFTRMIDGGIEAGPNAVLALGRESYRKSDINLRELAETLSWPGFRKVAKKYWRTGLDEMYRSFSKSAFTHSLQALVPEIKENDLLPGGAGVRAQACDRNGGLLDDFAIYETARAINVCNAPSPAATSSLSIAQSVAERVLAKYEAE